MWFDVMFSGYKHWACYLHGTLLTKVRKSAEPDFYQEFYLHAKPALTINA